MNKVTTIGIDLAKHVFQIAAADRRGAELWQKRLQSRAAFQDFIATLEPPLVVGLEAGLGAQAWARQLAARGLDVRVLPAQRVAEHRSGAKNDRNDALAILRALRDQRIAAVPIKTAEQLVMQSLHRARSGWVRRKTALSNQMRGLLLEHGVAMAKGDAALTAALNRLLADASIPVPDRLRDLIAELASEWGMLQQRIERMTAELESLAKSDPLARRLRTIRGVGPLSATAMACKGLDPAGFRNARQFAAYFGTVPDQHSSGQKVRLGRMSCRGDGYVRSLLIQGAHAVIKAMRSKIDDPDNQRIARWVQRHGAKGAAVRLANHNLRVAWALMRNDTEYTRCHGGPATH
ncbi:MAG TPA: IS110 family transposase [Rhodanobacteraceae bacterium]|nr:IS110 family transposase [Rhodanobacteraceae bacterium]